MNAGLVPFGDKTEPTNFHKPLLGRVFHHLPNACKSHNLLVPGLDYAARARAKLPDIRARLQWYTWPSVVLVEHNIFATAQCKWFQMAPTLIINSATIISFLLSKNTSENVHKSSCKLYSIYNFPSNYSSGNLLHVVQLRLNKTYWFCYVIVRRRIYIYTTYWFHIVERKILE